GGPASPPPQLVPAQIGGDAQEPGPEGLAAERADVAPRRDERLLRDVLRRLGLPQHAIAEVVDQGLVLDDQLIEGVEIAVLGSGGAIVGAGHAPDSMLSALPMSIRHPGFSSPTAA